MEGSCVLLDKGHNQYGRPSRWATCRYMDSPITYQAGVHTVEAKSLETRGGVGGWHAGPKDACRCCCCCALLPLAAAAGGDNDGGWPGERSPAQRGEESEHPKQAACVWQALGKVRGWDIVEGFETGSSRGPSSNPCRITQASRAAIITDPLLSRAETLMLLLHSVQDMG